MDESKESNSAASSVGPAEEGDPHASLPRWESFDGAKFGYRAWASRGESAETRTRAVVIAVHGLSGSVDDFVPLAGYLEPRGYSVYSWNLRGMGFDPAPERRGDLRDFTMLTEDLLAFIAFVREREGADAPLFLVGESLGAAVVVDAAVRRSTEIQGLILTAPVLQVQAELPWHQRWLFRSLLLFVPGKRIDLAALGDQEEVDPSRVTRLESRRRELKENEKYQPHFTLAALSGMLEYLNRGGDNLKNVREPVLVNYAGDDVFTEPRDLEALMERALPPEQVTLRFYEDSRHHLLFDPLTPDMMAKTERWMRDQLR